LIGCSGSNIACSYSTSGTTATITSYSGSGGSITLPASINGYTVTGIGDSAFLGCTDLQELEIGSGSIGAAAFYGCTDLALVYIASGVTGIGENAFALCTGLTTIYAYPTTAPTTPQGTPFIGISSIAVLHIPAGATGYDVVPWTYVKQVVN
jgi:hypothetical protein